MKTWVDDGRRYFDCPADSAAAADLRDTEGRRWHGGAWSLPDSARARRLADAHDFAERLGRTPQPRPYQGPALFWSVLKPFQQEDVQRLLRLRFAVNRNEQGTGKTYESIAWAAGPEPVVVVCPLAVMDQWIEAVRASGVSSTLSYTEQDGTLITVGTNDSGASAWIITTFDRCSKLKPIANITLIVDECTYVKNTKAKRTQSVLRLGAGARRILALSGHIMVNRPLDLWALFLLLRQRSEKEYWPWVSHYCGAYKTPYGWDLTGATHLRDLRDDIEGFSIPIRTLAEVAPQLPARTDTTVRIGQADLTTVERLYEELQGFIGRGVSIEHGEGFAVTQHLRVECGLVKVPFISDWLDVYFAGGGRKVLVFSDFHDPLKALAAKRKDMLVMTGDDSSKNREKIKAQFAEDPKIRVLGLTYGVGAMGLNLQHAASTVCLMDLPWTPKDYEQAPSRVVRMGQEFPQWIITFLCGHPIEVQMLQGLQYKEDISTALKRTGGLKVCAADIVIDRSVKTT